MRLLCDADEILYTAAFVAEQTAYKLEKEDGSVFDFGLQYTREQIKQVLGLKGKALKLDYKLHPYKVAVEDVDCVRTTIKNILNSISNLGGELELYLTSTDRSNFRYFVAKTRGPKGDGYKAGRPPKPIFYQDARNYLMAKGAIEVIGYEADDALGIGQGEDTVLVHIDKDINRIAGRHYNWKTKEKYVVEHPGSIWLEMSESKKKTLRGGGNIYFFAQMLMGDSTDNVPACGSGMGDVKVHKLLTNCDTELQCFDIVREQYNKAFGSGYEERMYEIADLLYIMDKEMIHGSEYLKRLGG